MNVSRVFPWRDPRLALGVLLIAGGGLAGAVALGGEATVPLLRAAEPIAQGSLLSESQFVIAELPARTGEGFLRSGQIPDGAVAAHAIGPGDLLTGSAVGQSRGLVDIAVPLLIKPATSVGAGATVDVWRVPGSNTPDQARVVAHGAILVAMDVDGTAQASAQIRVEPADVPAILAVLGAQDGIVIVGEAGR